ncbi:hypothetical protein VFPFJ_02576 [Purpureocillium lilacinum]|uniref:Uncharacterized protein n=1 Tax=Purpureocillium lilacinum TaxID=33203 RepID=A0A179HTN6_PURLI|nr:hypothetical protein VFPFJ_02576 [Purpureocillium lilacinum]OAQ93414.1 hypothetical protein VFPFJ_02576 [Purpureocillium lilacinum]
MGRNKAIGYEAAMWFVGSSGELGRSIPRQVRQDHQRIVFMSSQHEHQGTVRCTTRVGSRGIRDSTAPGQCPRLWVLARATVLAYDWR